MRKFNWRKNNGMGPLAEMLDRLILREAPGRNEFRAPKYDWFTDVELFIQQFANIRMAS